MPSSITREFACTPTNRHKILLPSNKHIPPSLHNEQMSCTRWCQPNLLNFHKGGISSSSSAAICGWAGGEKESSRALTHLDLISLVLSANCQQQYSLLNQYQLSRLQIALTHNASWARGIASSFFPSVPHNFTTKQGIPFTSTRQNLVHTSEVLPITEYSSESLRDLQGGWVKQVAWCSFHFPNIVFLNKMPLTFSGAGRWLPILTQYCRISFAWMRLRNHKLASCWSTPRHTGLFSLWQLQTCRVLMNINSLRRQSLALHTSTKGIPSIQVQLRHPSFKLMPGLLGLFARRPLNKIATGLDGTNLCWRGVQMQASSFILLHILMRGYKASTQQAFGRCLWEQQVWDFVRLQYSDSLLIKGNTPITWLSGCHLRDCWRMRAVFRLISMILLSSSFSFQGQSFSLLWLALTFFLMWLLIELKIFMCQLPFLGSRTSAGSFRPTTIREILSVEPLAIAQKSSASAPLACQRSPFPSFYSFSQACFISQTVSVLSNLSQRPSEPMMMKSWSSTSKLVISGSFIMIFSLASFASKSPNVRVVANRPGKTLKGPVMVSQNPSGISVIAVVWQILPPASIMRFCSSGLDGLWSLVTWQHLLNFSLAKMARESPKLAAQQRLL